MRVGSTTIGVMAGLVAMGLCGAASATAVESGAEQLHRLDIMMKVSQARCAKAGAEFRSDYAAFAGTHRETLDRASRQLRAQLIQRYGSLGGDQAFERTNLTLASDYAKGHPWLGCGDLKAVAHGLAKVEGVDTLIEAADQIAPRAGRARLAMIKR